MKLTDHDLQALEALLQKHPHAGAVLQGTGGLRKTRFAPPSRRTGKSGATRVIYYFVDEDETFYLFTIFGKSVRENLTPAEPNYYRAVLAQLKDYLKARR